MKTVSRVVNKEKYVAEETRQQVLRVIDELGYVPHLQAQRLASGRTRSIVLHYPLSNPNLLSNQIEMSFITGTALGAAEEAYYFSLMTGPLTSAGLMRLCRGAQADGLILMQIAVQDWRVKFLRENGYPFVMIGHCSNNEGLSFVDMDFEHAVMEAFACLISLGHQQIGFLTFPEEWRMKGIGPAMRALQGFKCATGKVQAPAPVSRKRPERQESPPGRQEPVGGKSQPYRVRHHAYCPGRWRHHGRAGNRIARFRMIAPSWVSTPARKPNWSSLPLTGNEWSGHEIGRQAAKMLIRELKGESPVPNRFSSPRK